MIKFLTSGAFLHSLGALGIMLVGWWFGYMLIALIVNTLIWPPRELYQKMTNGDIPLKFIPALAAIFSLHVLSEWVPAVLIGAIMYGVLR